MPDPVDIESYYDLRVLTQVAVGPDGDRVAFVAEEFDGADDERRGALYVVPADGSRGPHRLTRASGGNAPVWGPDGDRIAFLAARDDDDASTAGRRPDGDEDEDEPKTQVWVQDLARGGDARQLTAFEEGVREFDWSPDGDRFVVAARDPTEDQQEYLDRRREEDGPIEVTRLQHKRDGAGWLDDVRTYLFVAAVPADGETVDREAADRLDDAYGAGTGEPLHGLQPRWGPGGRIAFITCDAEWPDDEPPVDVFTIDPDGADRRKLTDGSLRAGMPRWSPDGDRLAFNGGNPENWYEPTETFVGDPETDEFWSVSASLDRTLGWPASPEWLDGDTIVTAVADEGWCRLVELDADEDDPRRVYEAQGRDRTVEAFDLAGGTVAVGLGEPAGLDVHAIDAADLAAVEDAATRLTDLAGDALADEPTPECRRVTYGNDDGDEVEAIAYLPAEFDPDGEPAPLIVSIHGGPMSYDGPTFDFKHTYWCSRGYVVLKPNYRGSTSYGREWAERLKGTRGDLESDDVVSGARDLVDCGWVDPDRMFCTGFSYGGITTAHVVARHDDFAAAAPEHGVYDFYSNFGTDDNHAWHEWEFGMPWENLETYRDISSITRVGEMDTPMLVTAGEEDWRCPPTQAEQLYVSLRKQGVDAKLVIYPGEHHNVGAPRRATHRLEELTSWFETHDPEIDDDGDDEGGTDSPDED